MNTLRLEHAAGKSNGCDFDFFEEADLAERHFLIFLLLVVCCIFEFRGIETKKGAKNDVSNFSGRPFATFLFKAAFRVEVSK